MLALTCILNGVGAEMFAIGWVYAWLNRQARPATTFGVEEVETIAQTLDYHYKCWKIVAWCGVLLALAADSLPNLT